MKIYEDLDQLQSVYSQTFNESLFTPENGFNPNYGDYLKRCRERNIPRSAIMNEEEFEACMSGDINPFTWETEDTAMVYYSEEDDEDYLEPKSKMTEDEAMEWFKSDDMFHQLFHKFMEKQNYHEQEVNGKQFWIKGKNS